MELVILALGSNIGDRNHHFDKAITLISNQIGNLLKQSSRIESKPLLHHTNLNTSQPDYLNMVVTLETNFSPNKLLERCQEIEKTVGRKREKEKKRWEARVIDIDIIAIDNKIVDTSTLIVPHREMHKRTFVLGPLQEIFPGWIHPTRNESVEEMLAKL